jgi:DNA-binding PadR family transcriptional regulator
MLRGRGRAADQRDDRLLRILARTPAPGHHVVKQLLADGPAPQSDLVRSVYAGLHRLERRGLVKSERCELAGRRITVKCYRVTDAGARRLRTPQVAAARPVPELQPVTWLVVMAVIGSGSTLAARGHPRRLNVAIFVDQRVPVSMEELRRARIDVNRIFGAIGVTIDWESEESSERLAQRPAREVPTDYVVHLVIIARVSGLSRSEALPLGLTPPGPHRTGADVVVFHDHVAEFAQVRHKSASSVLALVIAHEIGHALLPPPAHTSVGIMQGEWDQQTLDRADEYELRFTPQQGALIRDRLNNCCSLTAGR